MKVSELEQFERTNSCSCCRCRAACKSMPGMLAPGDMDKIAEYLGYEEITEDFLFEKFSASSGPLVVTRDGQQVRIPTIVPRQKENGHCVFLDENERCTIHPVAPFGCRCFSVCSDIAEPEYDARMCGALSCIADNLDYSSFHQLLEDSGHVARSLFSRRQRLDELLEECQ